MTDEMAEYLADENNPIDVKAAIINSLSWNISGKNNAELYCQMVYGKPLKEIDGKALSGDQQFCIGYLLAMDDIYFSTNQSVEYLRMARDNMPDSLRVALVTYLVEAMNEVAYDASEQLNQMLTDVSLKRDLSEEAIEIITNYMILGIDQPVNIPKTGVKSKGKIYGISAFVLLILAFQDVEAQNLQTLFLHPSLPHSFVWCQYITMDTES